MEPIPTAAVLAYYLDGLRCKRPEVRRLQARALATLGDLPAGELRVHHLRTYRQDREREVSASTVNRELGILRAAFRQARADELIGQDVGPCNWAMVREPPARSGFVTPGQVARIVGLLPAAEGHLVGFLFATGWRSGSVKALQWSAVDEERGVVELTGSETKQGLPVCWALTADVARIVAHRKALRRPGVPWVFHRDGRRIRSFRRSWATACRRAGCPELRPHDLRRSLALAHLEAGVAREITMSGAGWLSESIYRRYVIVPRRALADAQERAAAHADQFGRGSAGCQAGQ